LSKQCPGTLAEKKKKFKRKDNFFDIVAAKKFT